MNNPSQNDHINASMESTTVHLTMPLEIDHIHPQPPQACFQFAAHRGSFQAVPDLALVIPH